MSGKTKGKIILGVTAKHLKDKAVTGPKQYELMKGKSCLTSLITFPDQVMHLVGSRVSNGEFCLFVFLDFGIAFNTVSHNILQDKMPSFSAGQEHNTRGEQLPEKRGSKVAVKRVTSGWWPVPSGAPSRRCPSCALGASPTKA